MNVFGFSDVRKFNLDTVVNSTVGTENIPEISI